EGKRDQLLVGRQLDAADRSSELKRDRRCRGTCHLLERGKIERLMVMHILQLGLGAGECCRRPALLRPLRLLGKCGRAADERQENHGNGGNLTHRSPLVLSARPPGDGGGLKRGLWRLCLPHMILVCCPTG